MSTNVRQLPSRCQALLWFPVVPITNIFIILFSVLPRNFIFLSRIPVWKSTPPWIYIDRVVYIYKWDLHTFYPWRPYSVTFCSNKSLETRPCHRNKTVILKKIRRTREGELTTHFNFPKSGFWEKDFNFDLSCQQETFKIGKISDANLLSNHLTIRFLGECGYIVNCKIILRQTATHGATLELKLKNQCWGKSFLAAEIQTKWQNVPSRLLDRSFSQTHLIQTFINFAVGKTINAMWHYFNLWQLFADTIQIYYEAWVFPLFSIQAYN